VTGGNKLVKNESPEIVVGKSKFAELRPKHVEFMAKIPHNVCICKTHGNMDTLLQGIAKLRNDAPRSGRALIESQVCDRKNALCMLSACDSCNGRFIIATDSIGDEQVAENVKWRRWEDIGGQPVQVDVTVSLKEAVDQVNDFLPDYKLHCFLKDEQSTFFKESKNEIPEGRAVLQIDFAVNYALLSQDEVQSAHWSHSQVRLFTAVAWMKDGLKSLVVISDDLSHDKFVVWSMLKNVI